MDPLVENEAKLHITNGIEKASGATGVDIKVSVVKWWFARKRREIVTDLRWAKPDLVSFPSFSKLAKSWKNKWIDSMDSRSTAWWAKALALKSPANPIRVSTCTTQASWPCSYSSAERRSYKASSDTPSAITSQDLNELQTRRIRFIMTINYDYEDECFGDGHSRTESYEET